MSAQPRVLLVWGQYPRWIPPVTFSNSQITLAAQVKNANGFRDQGDLAFRYFEDFSPHGWLPSGSFDLVEHCDRNGLPLEYDFVILFLDQDMGIFPANISGFNCSSVLLVGDSHHFSNPISTLIKYVKREKIGSVVTQFTGHHTHWFRAAGITQSGFIPGLETREAEVGPAPLRIDAVSFIGHHWPYHHRRWSMLEWMRRRAVPLQVKTGTREDAARAYASSLISFNCSLNCDINIRNFEVLSSGGFLLTDGLPESTGFTELFRPGEACDTYGSAEELIDKLDYYRANPGQAERLARQGHAHFRKILRPRQAIDRFIKALFQGHGLDDCLPPDERCLRANDHGFDARLAAYEHVQELHRRQHAVRVLIKPSANWFQREDYIDLPRVELVAEAQAPERAAWDYTAA